MREQITLALFANASKFSEALYPSGLFYRADRE
jgi:hypothetical protein